MKTDYLIHRAFVIAVLSGMTLMAGAAQAHGWAQANPYLPTSVQVAPYYGNQHGPDGRFMRDPVARQDAIFDIDPRQQRQMQRIRAGIDSGHLSPHEARALLREQRWIERTQRHYLADGRLSRDEWLSLERLLDRASAGIRAQKQDRNWR